MDALRCVEASVFLVLLDMSEGGMSISSGEEGSIDAKDCCGVGVCISEQKAVTALHNLKEGVERGCAVRAYFPASRTRHKLTVEGTNKDLDYAVLTTDSSFSDHLPLCVEPLSSLVGQQLALCAFQLGIKDELPEWSPSSLGVLPAVGIKLSRDQHYLLYSSDTWSGDSGGALVTFNGSLVGLHLMGVNALKVQLQQKNDLDERLSVLEESVQSAVKSVANGCIALLAHVFALAPGA